MSDADSDIEYISDSSNAHSDDDVDDDVDDVDDDVDVDDDDVDDVDDDDVDDVDDEDDEISLAVRELCNQLRANDPCLSAHGPISVLSNDTYGYSEAECIEVFQALEENTSVKDIRLWINTMTQSSVLAAAEYVQSSQTLRTLCLCGNHVSLVIRL
jgi:hypothetical protein